MKTEIEHIDHLKPELKTQVKLFAMSRFATLESAAIALRDQFPNWFVYTGGRHVALHESAGADSPRILIVSAN